MFVRITTIAIMDIFSSHRDVELVIAYAALHVMFREHKLRFLYA